MRFAYEWYNEAKSIKFYDDKSKTAIFRFIVFWMSFNSYYAGGDPCVYEKNNIRNTVINNYSSLSTYNPFENGSNPLIHYFPVLDVHYADWLFVNPNSPAKQEIREYQAYINNGGVPILSPTNEQHETALNLLTAVKKKLEIAVNKEKQEREVENKNFSDNSHPANKSKKSPTKLCLDSIKNSLNHSRSIKGQYNTEWKDYNA